MQSPCSGVSTFSGRQMTIPEERRTLSGRGSARNRQSPQGGSKGRKTRLQPGFPILGVFRLNGQSKRDDGMIFRSCKASQSPVYPIGDAILAVNHASCPSSSSSAPRHWGGSALKLVFLTTILSFHIILIFQHNTNIFTDTTQNGCHRCDNSLYLKEIDHILSILFRHISET